MNEIEKMYRNSGVKKEVIPCPAKYYGYDCTRNNWDDEDCSCDIEGYPPFTAGKQIELIKWLARKDYGDYTSSISITITDDRCYFSAGEKPKYFANEVLYDSNRFTDFEQSLSNLINQLWQDLTEEERKQIKEILE